MALDPLLARLDKLEQAPSGAAIVDTIARRGFDRAERARLRELLSHAQGRLMTGDPGPSPEREYRHEELTALWRWYTDWSATARALLPRRDWLIALGLAARGRKGAAEAAAKHPEPHPA